MPLCHHKKEVIRSSTWSSMIAKVRRSHLCSSEMFLLPTGCTREALPRARFSRSNALVGCPSAHPPVAWTVAPLLGHVQQQVQNKRLPCASTSTVRLFQLGRGKTGFHHGASISTQIFRDHRRAFALLVLCSSHMTGSHLLMVKAVITRLRHRVLC